MTTIKDIATYTGFSVSTVSRVLNHLDNCYSKATEAKIRAAAEHLHYQKNQAASELVTRQSKTIMLVITENSTNFTARLIDGIKASLTKLDYNLLLIYAGNDMDSQIEATNLILMRPVQGVIIVSVPFAERELARIKQAQIPLVFASINYANPDILSVASDDWAIGYQATRYLLDQGHRRIGLAGVDIESYIGQERTRGYRQALLDAGLTYVDRQVFAGDYSWQAGKDAAHYFVHQEPVSAVIGASDYTAVGLLNGAVKLGLSVPTDLSILSIDGTDLSEMVQPALTVIKQDFYKMGIDSMRLLLGIIRGGGQVQSQVIPFKLIERGSVSPVEGA